MLPKAAYGSGAVAVTVLSIIQLSFQIGGRVTWKLKLRSWQPYR